MNMATNREEWVEGRQLTEDNATELADWCGGKQVVEVGPEVNTPGINVPTLRGPKRASLTDYIVLNVYDEFEVVNEYTYTQDL